MSVASALPVRHRTALQAGRAVPAALALAMAAMAWGALSFGAVYPWGYWPLAVACQICGFAGLLIARDTPRGFPSRALTASLALVAAAVVVQLIPLPAAWLTVVSPNTVDLLRKFDPLFAAGLTTGHPISIVPSDTRVALALYGSFVMLLLGLTRLLSLAGARRVAEMLTVLGVMLALVGIVQQPLYTGRIYGFWTPIGNGSPFGPFVNKNHFAGWMLLVLPITLALLCANLERAMRRVKPQWRDRLLWLSSPEANGLMLLAAAAVVMALSLVLTMSRSGMGAFTLSVVLTGWLVARRQDGISRKAMGVLYLVLLVTLVVGWVGLDAIVARFSDWSRLHEREGAWLDARAIAAAFPVFGTGLNSYGVATLFYQRHDLAQHYAQAHNDYLQLTAEGGALLAVPAVLCMLVLVRDIARAGRNEPNGTAAWLRAGAVTALVAIALQETVEFSLQMPGNAAMFALVCAVALHRAPGTEGGEHGRLPDVRG